MIAKTDRDIENEDFAHRLNAELLHSGIEVVPETDETFRVVIKRIRKDCILHAVETINAAWLDSYR